MTKYLIEICPEGHQHPPVDTGSRLQFCVFCGEPYLPCGKIASVTPVSHQPGKRSSN